MHTYTLEDIKSAVNKLNLKKKDIVYISGNLANFGIPKTNNLNDLPKVFFNSIIKKIGKNGTIVFPTHTFFLVNSNKIFNPINTLSESGAFSNYLIKNKKIYRQLHPYASISAVGAKAKYICSYDHRDVYGDGCPWEKLINSRAKFISLGLPINTNCTQVHFIEKQFNVPYRFNKMFQHKVKIKNKIKKKLFSMFVLKAIYKNFKRNKNKIIIKNFTKRNKIKKIKLGKGLIYSYDIYKFYKDTFKLFKKNIHAWSGKKIY